MTTLKNTETSQDAIVGESVARRGLVGKSVDADAIVGSTAGPSAAGVKGFHEGPFNPSAIAAPRKPYPPSGVLGVGQETAAGVRGFAGSGPGVAGTSRSGNGVVGTSSSGDGVVGSSEAAHTAGVRGVHKQPPRSSGQVQVPVALKTYAPSGVLGTYDGRAYGTGVRGDSPTGDGVLGTTLEGNGVVGLNEWEEPKPAPGPVDDTPPSIPRPAEWPEEDRDVKHGNGVFGETHVPNAGGVCGVHKGVNGAGVIGLSRSGDGVVGQSLNSRGVVGVGQRGVVGLSPMQYSKQWLERDSNSPFFNLLPLTGTGIHGQSGAVGVHGLSTGGRGRPLHGHPGVIGHVQLGTDGDPTEYADRYYEAFQQRLYEPVVTASERPTVLVNLGPLEVPDGLVFQEGDKIGEIAELIELIGPIGVLGRGPIGVKGIGNPGVVGVDKEGDRERGKAEPWNTFEFRRLKEGGRRSGVYARGNPAVYMETRGEKLIVGEVLERPQKPQHGWDADEKTRTVFSVDRDGRGHFESGVHAKGELPVYMQTSGPNLIVGETEVNFALQTVFYVTRDGRGYFAGGFDLAEPIASQEPVAPGAVVEIDPERDNEFRMCAAPNSTSVAGVVSTNPGVSLGAWGDASAQPQLALAGRVPVKVSAENGPIHPGDLLVSSSTPGHAMRAPSAPTPGTVVGKALGRLDRGTGVIELLVMLR